MKVFRRWLYVWKRYFKIFFHDIDWTADDWREQSDHLWRYRHTFWASPKAAKLYTEAVLRQLNADLKAKWYGMLKRDFQQGRIVFPKMDNLQDELEDYGMPKPPADTGKLRSSVRLSTYTVTIALKSKGKDDEHS